MTASDLPTLDLLAAVEDLAAPAYVIDRDGRFSWVNQALIERLGDLRGRPFVEHVAPEHRQLARTNFTRKVVGKTTKIFDLTVLDTEGRKVTLRITSAPLRRGGQIVGIFGVGIPLVQGPGDGRAPLEGLTPRQHEVLSLLAEGLDTPEIARRLGVAPETARNHIRALLRATGAHSRLEAVLFGFRAGLIGADLTHPGQQDDDGAADE
ncbi:MAG TPA: LuxR C-terminal-related transcriptional regulator [Gaiellaceae bacterium]|nr:LuxR C-terminal-related transcriptional regulator [Gaiellaceae bacterium]